MEALTLATDRLGLGLPQQRVANIGKRVVFWWLAPWRRFPGAVMKVVLAIVGVLALLASVGSCVTAKSAIQETVGVTLLIVATLCLGFAALIEEIQRHNNSVVEQFGHLAAFLRERLK
jgi:hypothetical protein